MKTIIESWHSGISGTRLAAKFAAHVHTLREEDAADAYNVDEVSRAAGAFTKD